MKEVIADPVGQKTEFKSLQPKMPATAETSVSDGQSMIPPALV